MDSPPPVPPKDSPYAAKMEAGRTPASSSKRKREVHENDGPVDAADADEHSQKRPRSNRQNDVSTSDNTTPARRNLRRKKKHGNLSNLNLRHAAERQASEQAARESKFQEGSLNDKPSEKPPSAFTRVVRSESGNLEQVDQLMEDYHESIDTEPAFVEAVVQQETAQMAQRVDNIAAESAGKEEAGGFFRFGRNFSTNFHPIALWNKLWNETKEELTQRNIDAAMRKRKEEAEARYAEMKKAGQLGLQPVGNFATGEGSTPRDSGIAMESARSSQQNLRPRSSGSQALVATKEYNSNESEGPETATKPKATLRSRFSFRKPSISNFKDGIKRVKSDFNLAAAAGNRESSSSVSPVKEDLENSTLRRSQSRFDLKKHNKLSKRVSDLEVKLQQARRELDEALVEASPAPKFRSKYERFTSQTLRKAPKFVPGRLPTLPSEGILMTQDAFGDDEYSPDKEEFGEAQPRKALDLTEAVMEEVDECDDATIKAPRGEDQYPARAESLFKFANRNIEHLPPTEDNHADIAPQDTSELTQLISEDVNMDPNSSINPTNDEVAADDKPADYASLDARLKALDENVKISKKGPARTKKRKTGGDDGDKAFRPGKEVTDDDDEWTDTPKKKRKSTSSVKNDSSPPAKRGKATGGNSGSPKGKKATNGVTKNQKKGKKQPVTEEVEEQYSEDEPEGDAQAGAEEDILDAAPVRTSLDSQGTPLEPLYEEEEETTTVPINDEPSKPTAKATPARYGRHAVRSRSGSPHKRSGSVPPGAEEQMMTRAAEVAKTGRVFSPPPNGYSKVTEVVNETVTVVPGQGDVPALPEGVALEQVETTKVVRKEKEQFEWPDDVF
jgi:hypothetical protein